MRTCENCKYSEPMVGALACMGQKGMPYVRPTDSCDRWKTMKQTNYDRIISKTPEELARYMAEIQMQRGCPNDGAMDCRDNCAVCWLDWLKQEAKE